MSKDLEMKDVPSTADKDAKDAKKEVKKPEVPRTVVEDIQHNFTLLQQAVTLLEWRFTTKVLRTLPNIRKRLNPGALRRIIEKDLSKSEADFRESLLAYIPKSDGSAMDVDSADASKGESKNAETEAEPVEPLPEIEIYVMLLVMVWLLDQGKLKEGTTLSVNAVSYLQQLNRRTLDQLAARIYFYYARFHELGGAGPDGLAEIRPTLLAAQRKASLRQDDELQATLLNLLLRNYYHYNLFDQADKLIDKAKFPSESDHVGNGQWARWLYYLGRLRAIQLNYTEAHQHLQTAIRRAPKAQVAPGFLQTAYKLFIVVELLMGDIPERAIFRQPVLKKALVPYLQIVQAVRTGNLASFSSSLSTHLSRFREDGTYTLIVRLRHNVIKTALRTISLAYSRISLSDVCQKLNLDSEEDAEYIVAKAIRDGVIDAQLDHEKGYMKSRETADVYSTNEPQNVFHSRISFCLKLHNESVKAMRYPLTSHLRKELASAEEARERERELVKGIENEDLDPDSEL